MILASALFHLSALFTLQLLALTGALFLFIYVGKQELNRWFSMTAAIILGLVLLTMVTTFVGAICMHCHHERHENEERSMMMHGDFGPGMGEGHHRRIIRIERDGPEGMDMENCPGMGQCSGSEPCMGGGKDMDCCKGETCTMAGQKGMDCCKGGTCTMDGKKVVIKKDTIIEKKMLKK
jgi:hypothetical protein